MGVDSKQIRGVANPIGSNHRDRGGAEKKNKGHTKIPIIIIIWVWSNLCVYSYFYNASKET